MTTKIKKDETLIVVALEDELNKNDLVGWRIIYTGIGKVNALIALGRALSCLLYTSPSPRDQRGSRMPSSA